MIKKDMNTGVVYGFMRHSHSRLVPAIVLDMSTLWEYRYNRFAQRSTFTPTTRTRPGSLSDWETWNAGYLAVVASNVEYDEGGHTQAVADLKTVANRVKSTIAGAADGKLTPEHVEAIDESMPDRLRLQVIHNRKLVGTWAEANAADTAEREAKRREHEAEARRDRWERSIISSVNAALVERNLNASAIRSGTGRAGIDLEALAHLLGVELPPLEAPES